MSNRANKKPCVRIPRQVELILAVCTDEGSRVFVMNNAGDCPVIANSAKVFNVHVIFSLWRVCVYGR